MAGYHKVLSLQLAAASANNIALSQTPGAAGPIVLNGSTVSGGVATLDVARRVIITQAGNEPTKTYTVTGTDRNGRVQSEIVQGTNIGVVTTIRDYLTITSIVVSAALAGAITVGTNATAASAPYVVDRFINPGEFAYALVAGAGNTNTLQISYDDFAEQNWDLVANTATWIDYTDDETTDTTTGRVNGPVTMIRLAQTAGTALSKATIINGLGNFR